MFGPLTPDDFQKQGLQQMLSLDLDYENRLSESYIRWDGERLDDVLSTIAKGDGHTGNGSKVLVVQATECRGGKRKSLQRDGESSWMSFVRDRIGDKYHGVVVEGSGHWPHVDKTEEIAQDIKSFEKT